MPHRTIPNLIDQIARRPYAGRPRHGLNRAQWAALRYFATVAVGQRTATAFARSHGTTKGTASQTILALIRKGLLARTPMPGDGRSHRIALTDEAEALLRDDPASRLARAVQSLPVAQQHSLAEHLEALSRALQQVGEAAPGLEPAAAGVLGEGPPVVDPRDRRLAPETPVACSRPELRATG